MSQHLPEITGFAVLNFLIIALTIPWVLTIKKNTMSAIAWCLVVVLLPVLGFALFVIFGYNYVYRPLKRKRRHRLRYRTTRTAARGAASSDDTWQGLGRLAMKFGDLPLIPGNEITLYHDTVQGIEELFDAIKDARKHVHVQYFIIQPDDTGRRFFNLLAQKAKEGVEVRVLYDAIGSMYLRRRMIRTLTCVGGQCTAFMTPNPLRRRFQINMRNHRKIAVIDGQIAFTGGINIGDEYLGKDPAHGPWRDGHLRLEGPAVAMLQNIFAEDWDFAQGETIKGASYFPELPTVGDSLVQIIDSGPDQEVNSLRETVFAAIVAAQERLWVATPYFVPDNSILDAIRLASYRGVDVRLLLPLRPDAWLPWFAARYYWQDLMAVGVKVYQYARGMMHAKILLVDGRWGMVGSANLDNRSLHLNFEVNCVLHTPADVADLEKAFLQDLKESIEVDPAIFARRPFSIRLVENASRLFSPVL